MDEVAAPHPGRLLADLLCVNKLTQARFAELIGRPPQVVSEIITGRKSITAQTAVEVSEVLGTSPMFWLVLQAQHDLAHLRVTQARQRRQRERRDQRES